LSHTVLICDDAIFMRTMVGDILTQAGFEVVGEAETGVQAVEKYQQLRPDLVTMDIVMPDMGGIDAVREICKLDPNAKILMCSAMGQQALVVEAIQAGAKDFVVKPFQPSRVLEAVLLLIGASLLVSMVEQLAERRRLLAMLVAVGTRRSVLGWSVLWQAAIPVLLGLALALGVGLSLGVILLAMVNSGFSIDWVGILGIVGIAGLVVLLVTALAMPVLYRLMRTTGLRTE